MQANKYYEKKDKLINGIFMALEPLKSGFWKVWNMESNRIHIVSATDYVEIEEYLAHEDFNIYESQQYKNELAFYQFGEELEQKYRTFGSVAWRCMRYQSDEYEALKELASNYGGQVSAFVNGMDDKLLIKCLKEMDTEFKELKQIIESYFETKEIPDGFLSTNAS